MASERWRGAADTSHGGRVTLAEAYDCACGRTIDSAAAAARAGSQAPELDMDLRARRVPEAALAERLSDATFGRVRWLVEARAAYRWGGNALKTFEIRERADRARPRGRPDPAATGA